MSAAVKEVEVKERFLILSSAKVRALLEDRKTQERIPLKPQPLDVITKGAGTKSPKPTRVINGHRSWCAKYTDDPIAGKMIYCRHGEINDRLRVVQIRPIQFGNGRFGIGDDGQVYRVDGPEPVAMKPSTNKKGYRRISLRFKGEMANFLINRLVAEAFVCPRPSEHHETRHLDDDPGNNQPSNLDWGTRAENTQDRLSTGRGIGSKHPYAKLSDDDVKIIRSSDDHATVLAKRFGVHRTTILHVRSRLNWSTTPSGQGPAQLSA